MSPEPRVLYIAWRSPETQAIYPLGRLIERLQGPRYEFAYIEGVRDAVAHGFLPFLSFPELEQVYYSNDLLPVFQNRLMSSGRPDYREYVAQLGLDPDAAHSIDILARSAGLRATDKLEVFAPPIVDDHGRYLYHFLLRGIRHVRFAEERVRDLGEGERLCWMRDPQNEFDPSAIALRTRDKVLLGYLPFYLAEDFARIVEKEHQLEVTAERINRPPVPVQRRVLCRLVTGGRPGFRPFATGRYAPIAREAMALSNGGG